MTLEDLLKNEFDSTIRTRGREYFQDGRVSLFRQDSNLAVFKVKGEELYYSSIQYDKTAEDFVLACDCPYFASNLNCKHLWASVLEVDRRKMLGWLIGKEKVQEEEQPRWQEMLQQIQRKLDRNSSYKKNPKTQPLAEKNTGPRVGMYAVNVPNSLERGQIQLHLYVRNRLKKGELAAVKPAELSHTKIQFYENPTEREFLWDLVGRTEVITSFYSGNATKSKVNTLTLTSGHADAIMRKISDAQLLYQLKGEDARYLGFYDAPNLQPLKYEKETWTLQFILRKSDTGYVLIGELVSDVGETRALTDLVSYMEYFAFFQNSIARSDLREHEIWYELVKLRPLPIAEHELESFLNYFWNESQAKIAIELPPEIKMVERTGIIPVPQISFEASQGRASFAARLSFKYDGEIADANTGKYIYKISTREKIARNIEFERQCLAMLHESSVIDSEDLQFQAYFTATQFLPTVEKFLSLSWLVFARDQKIRTGTDYQINISSGLDWFDVHTDIKFDDKFLSMPKLLGALKSGERMITLDDGSLGILPEEWLHKLAPFVGIAKATDDGLRLNKVQALFLTASLDESIQFSADQKFKNLKNIISDLKNLTIEKSPAGFRGDLREYQQTGLGWLKLMSNYNLGGVLADDMGLGKTIQVLALLAARDSKLPNLVLAPKSLIFNWQNEAAKFAPHLKVMVYAGGGRQSLISQIATHDIVLATYQTLRNDIEAFQKIKFNYLILDEAQNLKNSQSQITMAAKLIVAQKKLALTGTPIENSILDLFSILSVVTPGLVTHAQADRWARENDVQTIGRLSKALSPFILRRTKEQVLKDLPEKTEQVLYCELSPSERAHYDDLKKFYWAQLTDKIEEKGLAKTKIDVLEALLRLRQAACHQGLIDKKMSDAPSTKFELVAEQLDTVIEDGHKALVFSQFTSLLGLFAKKLESKGIEFEYLDGQTQNREERVANFQNNKKCQVFLLSLKAGGVGLNLTAADYVFILDPWWNPAAESQAIDRTHRIGQTKKVFAYKIIAKDTVEEKILSLQEKKKGIAKAVISEDAQVLKGLSLDDLKDLFI